MPLDASLYGAFGVRPRSVADFDAEAMTREQNQLALVLARQQAAERAQGMQENSALRQVLAGGADLGTPEGQRQALAAAPLRAMPLIKERVGLEKDRAQAAHYQAQAGKFEEDQRLARHQRHLAGLVAVQTPQDAAAWADEGLRAGIFTPEQYQRGLAAMQQAATSPQTFGAWKAQTALGGLTLQQQLQQQIEAQRLAETGRHNRAAEATQAGQLGVARERLAADASAARGGIADKPPSGYRWGADGTLVAIPGGPADPAVKAQAAKAQSDKPPAEVRRMNIALRALEQGLDAYEQKLRTFNVRSLDQLSPTQRAAFDSLFADLQMQAKEAQALGALTGPDVAILERTLANPASLRGMAYGNEGLKAQITAARDAVKRRKDAMAAEFGGGDAPAAAGPGPIAQAAPRRIASDAEYAALPSGTEFIAPDGSRRRKP